MQTTFDGSLWARTTREDEVMYDDILVAMRTEDGGLELLGEGVTLLLSPVDVRTLLFYGSTVELGGPAKMTASIGVDPRRYAIVLVLDGRAYRAPRWAITAVARGRLPAAYLQANHHRPRTAPFPGLFRAARMAEAHD